ncbi:alkaline phosphatase family protein [Nocardioides sp. LHG3406-4]|uniref:alkaline phosphatase family protein n=1 Tax=Nocardioides sp. LHG3406-4 TaxID=2804575 RepID=UPI003CEE1DF7
MFRGTTGKRSRIVLGASVAAVCVAAVGSLVAETAQADPSHGAAGLPGGYKHLVVIYEENHSFDNLYGGWGDVNGQAVEGRTATGTPQVDKAGNVYGCLEQNDVNILAAGPTSGDACGTDPTKFANKTFQVNDYIQPSDKTCALNGAVAFPAQAHGLRPTDANAVAGGCTEDIVHRFYQEQYQIDGGKQNRYVAGSDAAGLTMGYYDTKQLPIYKYLHSADAPNYVLADHFFQAAFGGSFLNHQFLVAGRAPVDSSNGALGGVNSVLDASGFPTTDSQETKVCAPPTVNDREAACGHFAVNTIQSTSAPHGGGAAIPLIDDADYPNIGDRLTDAKVSWNWYSGGWDDAVAGHPGAAFQYHHQPLNYFKNYAEGGSGRSHLKDENDFMAAAASGELPAVSFVKPYGTENEHPGYASETTGSDHLVNLIKTIENGRDGKDTLIVVTYDEFGGQYDHVAPPAVDAWGPGTRIPALVIGAKLGKSGVDHTVYDTTSILATIEHSYGLRPLGTRDAVVNDLTFATKVGDKH